MKSYARSNRWGLMRAINSTICIYKHEIRNKVASKPKSGSLHEVWVQGKVMEASMMETNKWVEVVPVEVEKNIMTSWVSDMSMQMCKRHKNNQPRRAIQGCKHMRGGECKEVLAVQAIEVRLGNKQGQVGIRRASEWDFLALIPCWNENFFFFVFILQEHLLFVIWEGTHCLKEWLK